MSGIMLTLVGWDFVTYNQEEAQPSQFSKCLTLPLHIYYSNISRNVVHGNLGS